MLSSRDKVRNHNQGGLARIGPVVAMAFSAWSWSTAAQAMVCFSEDAAVSEEMDSRFGFEEPTIWPSGCDPNLGEILGKASYRSYAALLPDRLVPTLLYRVTVVADPDRVVGLHDSFLAEGRYGDENLPFSLKVVEWACLDSGNDSFIASGGTILVDLIVNPKVSDEASFQFKGARSYRNFTEITDCGVF